MDEIKYYENKEIIEEYLEELKTKFIYLEKIDKKIPLVNIKRYNESYLERHCGTKQITLEEGEDNFKVNIYVNGYISEHPYDKKIMNKECDTEAFINVIKEQTSSALDKRIINDWSMDKTFKLIGFTFKKNVTLDENSSNKYEENNRFSIILYGEDEESNIYRIEMMTIFGVGEDEFDSSWGEDIIEKLEDIDKNEIIKNLIFTTNKKINMHIHRNTIKTRITVYEELGDILLGLCCDYSGWIGDDYPTGTVDIFYKNETTDINSNTDMLELINKLNDDFIANKKNLEKVLEAEERIDIRIIEKICDESENEKESLFQNFVYSF